MGGSTLRHGVAAATPDLSAIFFYFTHNIRHMIEVRESGKHTKTNKPLLLPL